MENLRAYFFNNQYLTGINAGIQAQHCTTEMFVKYDEYSSARETLYEWANHHKTTIILNGGYALDLYKIVELFSSKDNPYPWDYFRESDEALNGCITSVGIILPEKVYNYYDDMREYCIDGGVPEEFITKKALTPYETLLVDCVSNLKLMS